MDRIYSESIEEWKKQKVQFETQKVSALLEIQTTYEQLTKDLEGQLSQANIPLAKKKTIIAKR